MVNSKWFHPFSFSNRNFTYGSLPSVPSNMLRPAFLPSCNHPNNILRAVQNINLQNLRVSPSSCDALPNRSKHSVLKRYLLPSIYLWGQEHKKEREIIISYNIFLFRRPSARTALSKSEFSLTDYNWHETPTVYLALIFIDRNFNSLSIVLLQVKLKITGVYTRTDEVKRE